MSYTDKPAADIALPRFHKRTNCREIPSLFAHEYDERGSAVSQRIEEARARCVVCPIAPQCLKWGTRTPGRDHNGYLGGHHRSRTNGAPHPAGRLSRPRLGRSRRRRGPCAA
ncbi:WhiB family transcriptional regulator [Streptomyces sp. NPDC005794]|uniref:WhiB family transcriptional regulator n=1 Tax=Streptomyces sp. NPDC005794 TaxID=3364733 RepID=UPI003689FF75